MFARFSTAFCALLGLVALLDVNAGIVPAARNLDKRTNVVGVGNYAEPALYAEPVTRDFDLDKRTNVVGVGNYAEPALYAEPVTRDLDFHKRTNVAGVGNNAESDPDY
ncbi:hypothetical protein DFH29DRAFT_894460 [Suillus ampliporus]|nr:hypothetical protein DFH29DRAFT_894460 [Suillus ampliporus]